MGQNVGAGMAGVGRSSDSRLYALWDAVDPNCHSGDFEQTWLDLSGNNRTATRTTQPSTTAGFNGTAIPQFTREGLLFSDQADCCFTLGSRVSDSSFYNDGMTVLATIKTTNSDSSPSYGGDAAATILGDTNGGVIWSFGIEAGKIKWTVYNGSWYSYVSFGTVNDNKWHQIAVTREPGRPSELKFYIDGELDRVEGASTSYTSIAFNAIGKGYNNADRYTGYLRNLAVWNKVLTGSEIREIYNAQGGFDPKGKGPHISAGLNGTAEDPRPSKGARFFLGFKYRQIINYAYTAGGYKSSIPWKSVHKTVASTDQTSNLGDQLTYAANYTSGGCNYRLLFMWAASNSHPGSSTSTVTMNMFTDTLFTPTTAMNMQTTRNDCGTVFKEHDFAWICGGGSTAVDKFNYTNETMASSALSGGINNSAAHGALSGFSDQHYGYWYHQSAGQKITFATDTLGTKTNVS